MFLPTPFIMEIELDPTVGCDSVVDSFIWFDSVGRFWTAQPRHPNLIIVKVFRSIKHFFERHDLVSYVTFVQYRPLVLRILFGQAVQEIL